MTTSSSSTLNNQAAFSRGSTACITGQRRGLERWPKENLSPHLPISLPQPLGILKCGQTTTPKNKWHIPFISNSGNGLKHGCWNSKTMQDSANRPAYPSALTMHKLTRLDINVTALSEVYLPEEGSLRVHGVGYTLYSWGKPKKERLLSGAGFMVRDTIASRLTCQPFGHSEHIISFHSIQLCHHQNATLFTVYAPTLQVDSAKKDMFYVDLYSFLQKVPPTDKIVILGDFSASVRVGWYFKAWTDMPGKHCVGGYNDSRHLLLECWTACWM